MTMMNDACKATRGRPMQHFADWDMRQKCTVSYPVNLMLFLHDWIFEVFLPHTELGHRFLCDIGVSYVT